MTPNINLHIDSILLDGLDLAPGQAQLLQQVVVSQLATMLTAQHSESRFTADDRVAHKATNSILLGQSVDASTLSPQLATAIYANIPEFHFSPQAASGGQP